LIISKVIPYLVSADSPFDYVPFDFAANDADTLAIIPRLRSP
jgi:hypothetical protein